MTTTTDTAALHPIDPRGLLDLAIATGGTVVAGVGDDQLSAPTPCHDMDVRAMLGHLVGVLDRIATVGEDGDVFSVVETDSPDVEWPAAWARAAGRATDAWRDDSALDRPVTLPWIRGSGADVLTSYLSELTVHTWDLATATGQQPRWDDSVVTAALEAPSVLPAENRRAMFEEISAALGLDDVAVPFADAVDVADDADPIDRLVAWNGRDPRLKS